MPYELRLPDTNSTKLRARTIWSLAVIAFAETNLPEHHNERAATFSELSDICGFPKPQQHIIHENVGIIRCWDDLLTVAIRADEKPIVKINPAPTIPVDPPTRHKGSQIKVPSVKISFA